MDEQFAPSEFSTGKGGRPLLVPVVWNGEPLLFLLDTGAPKTGFDSSLKSKLGDPIGQITRRTSAGLVETEEFPCPTATVGGIPMDSVETVFCTDLQPLRYASGEDIRGVLGVDFLRRLTVTIDFDRGRLQLLETSQSNPAAGETWIPMDVDKSGRPHVIATIGNARYETLLVDTGSTGETIRSELYDALVQTGEIATGDPFGGMTAGGGFTQSAGYFSGLQVDRFSLGAIRVARHLENSVGLNWLSRFQVSLDFPNRRIMLRKGSRFDEPFSRATSGMAVVDVDGRKIVVEVRPGSPASSAGVQRGDELIVVGNKRAVQMDMFTVGKTLTANVGQTVDLTIARGSRTFSVSIRLADRLNSPTVR